MLLPAKSRQKILKFPGMRQISNLYVNITNTLFYSYTNFKWKSSKKIKSLNNSANNIRCFIVGSGPSLTKEQLDAIKNEETFGANRIYKMFENTVWRPKYYVIQDPYDITPTENYEKLNVEYLFISDYYLKEHFFCNNNMICYHTIRTLRQKEKLPFSKKIDKFVQVAGTVTYTMIQMAVYMGYKEIYLIGMDHNYNIETNDKGDVVQKNNVKNHAFEDENPKEVVANITYMEDAYNSAKDYCIKNNIKIYNATIGGKLEVFERRDFWKVIKGE